VVDETGRALWFSKQILPAIRREKDIRASHDFSPVYQHIGLYGFRYDILKTFVTLKTGIYETLEGLEQLRLLENGIAVHTVTIDVDAGLAQAGIDSPEDVARAESLLARA
jgi:3-deoxy-manno-octulosonate cytidylyltransferase (CMP-KDO synthetase)